MGAPSAFSSAGRGGVRSGGPSAPSLLLLPSWGGTGPRATVSGSPELWMAHHGRPGLKRGRGWVQDREGLPWEALSAPLRYPGQTSRCKE